MPRVLTWTWAITSIERSLCMCANICRVRKTAGQNFAPLFTQRAWQRPSAQLCPKPRNNVQSCRIDGQHLATTLCRHPTPFCAKSQYFCPTKITIRTAESYDIKAPVNLITAQLHIESEVTTAAISFAKATKALCKSGKVRSVSPKEYSAGFCPKP